MGSKRRRRGADTEETRIEWIRDHQGGLPGPVFPVGIGDDGAVWRPRPGKDVVLTVDTQAEGTHFRRGWLSSRDLGRRAVTVSVSDLAAMAAVPRALLVSILADDRVPDREFREVCRGVLDASREYAAPVAGGNISRGPLSITVTAVGEVERGGAARRSGLRAGDEVWVTGRPGLARLGLLLLGGEIALPARSALARKALAAFRRPTARLEEARFLARRWPLSAMIDLSDGLARDLRHLVEAAVREGRAAVGIEVEGSALPSPEVAAIAGRAGLSPLGSALEGGDDYELCFTAGPRPASLVSARAFEKRFDVPVRRIGRVVESPGLWLRRESGAREPVDTGGWEHFPR